MGKSEEILDLSHSKLKKLNKFTPKESQITELILDDNELQRLDNIDSLVKLEMANNNLENVIEITTMLALLNTRGQPLHGKTYSDSQIFPDLGILFFMYFQLSACRNQLLRMYGVCRLHNLHSLNLSNNGILTIEGLKELSGLKRLCLSGNSIKTIEHLNNNISLEYLDLSENSITHISDISFLKALKELFLHKNKINHLGQCDRFLPNSLTTLTLANNNIGDLNEISRLAHLVNLTKITLANNPCVTMTGNNIGFDYRPFVINWCLNVNVIDDYVVDAIESLRAEWLYSQGRGRHFKIGDQRELANYLATVCPLTGETLETEDDRKLRLILSKAQHHQQQLREQSSSASPQPSPATKKRNQQIKNSPRLNSLRMGNRIKSPDRMAISCYNALNGSGDHDSNSIMTQSLDASVLRHSITPHSMSASYNIGIAEMLQDVEPINSPLQAVTKMVPVPESLMSPDYKPSPLTEKIRKAELSHFISSTPTKSKYVEATKSPKSNRVSSSCIRPQVTDGSRKESGTPSPNRRNKVLDSNITQQDLNRKTSILRTKSLSSDEESALCDSKLEIIQTKAEEKRIQKHTENSNNERVRQAVVYIQKMWRGYYTRNKDKDVQEMFKVLQNQRATQYIQKLATDMETTKSALESERKIQMLQTEAISALWKKISLLQGVNNDGSPTTSRINMTSLNQNNAEVVRELAQTCSVLQDQIQQLQHSMQDILKVMTIFSQSTGISPNLTENGIATQTEIVAVHTPQVCESIRSIIRVDHPKRSTRNISRGVRDIDLDLGANNKGDGAKLFPFQKYHNLQQSRPSSLPLPVSQRKKDNTQNVQINSELRHFAGTLVDGVIRTVSETTDYQESPVEDQEQDVCYEEKHKEDAVVYEA